MKKGSTTLIFVCALSLCLIIGIFIGRSTTGHNVSLQHNDDTAVFPVQATSREFRINVNTATKIQLMELPGIGSTLAERIIAYRAEHGLFQSTDDLMNVEGIGKKKLLDIEHLITAGG